MEKRGLSRRGQEFNKPKVIITPPVEVLDAALTQYRGVLSGANVDPAVIEDHVNGIIRSPEAQTQFVRNMNEIALAKTNPELNRGVIYWTKG